MPNASSSTGERRPLRVMPPVYLLFAILAMIGLHLLYPGATLLETPWRWLGAAILTVGLAIGLSAVRLFGKYQTTIKPGQRSSHLMTDGPYRFTRNPIYLGMVLLLAGVATMLGTATPWLVLPAFVAIIARIVIPVEESMMSDAFGQHYEDYRAKVRRWI